jgi:hypothetical protein
MQLYVRYYQSDLNKKATDKNAQSNGIKSVRKSISFYTRISCFANRTDVSTMLKDLNNMENNLFGTSTNQFETFDDLSDSD